MAGLSFSLEGAPFVVAGVYEHERDAFSRAAYGGAMTVYMSFAAFQRINAADSALANKVPAEINTVACYELVTAEPVKGFAYSAVTDKFPNKNTLFVENTYRFEPDRLFGLLKNRTARSMSVGSFEIPYWENAARAAEDRAAAWLAAAVLTAAFPLVLLLYELIRTAVHGKKKLEEDILPGARAKSREFIREQSRRRWERRHPDEF